MSGGNLVLRHVSAGRREGISNVLGSGAGGSSIIASQKEAEKSRFDGETITNSLVLHEKQTLSGFCFRVLGWENVHCCIKRDLELIVSNTDVPAV